MDGPPQALGGQFAGRRLGLCHVLDCGGTEELPARMAALVQDGLGETRQIVGRGENPGRA